VKYAWIEAHRDSYSLTLMCQLSAAVLLIADFLHPHHVLPMLRRGERQVGHGRTRCRAVPVLDAGRTPRRRLPS
jgi:hypothetical protein